MKLFPQLSSLSPLLACVALFGASPVLALEVGDTAPCVVLENVQSDGSSKENCIRDHEESQRYTLIEFFSINCQDCAANLPRLSALAQEIEGTTATRLVSIDRNDRAVRSYIDDHRDLIQFPVALDFERSAKRAYDVVATPTVFILDGNHQVIFKHTGVFGSDDLEAIRALVK